MPPTCFLLMLLLPLPPLVIIYACELRREKAKNLETAKFSSELDLESHRMLYASASTELAFLTGQQWSLTNYFLLIDGALVALAESGQPYGLMVCVLGLEKYLGALLSKIILLFLLCALFVVAVFFIFEMQWRQRELRIGVQKNVFVKNRRKIDLFRLAVYWADDVQFDDLVRKQRRFPPDMYGVVFLVMVTIGWIVGFLLIWGKTAR